MVSRGEHTLDKGRFPAQSEQFLPKVPLACWQSLAWSPGCPWQILQHMGLSILSLLVETPEAIPPARLHSEVGSGCNAHACFPGLQLPSWNLTSYGLIFYAFDFFFPLLEMLMSNPLTSCVESLPTQQTITLMFHSYSWYRCIHRDTGVCRKNIRFSGTVTGSRAVPLLGAGRGCGEGRRHPGGEWEGGVYLGRLYLHFPPLVSLSGKLGPSLGLWKWLQGSLY